MYPYLKGERLGARHWERGRPACMPLQTTMRSVFICLTLLDYFTVHAGETPALQVKTLLPQASM